MKKYFLALLFLPGTFLHELSHFLMAKILFVKVVSFNIFPKKVENEFRLGSVTTVKTDLVRGTLIGLAPFLVGAGILVWIFTMPITILSILVIIEIIHSMLLSYSDIIEFVKLGVLALVIFLVYKLIHG